MNEFKREKEILEGVSLAEQFLQRDKDRKCDWKDVEDRRFYRMQMGNKDKDRRLDKFVPNRVCKRCGKKYLDRSSWVFLKGAHPICRSCAGKVRGVNFKAVHVDGELVKSTHLMIRVEGYVLTKIRLATGLSQRSFAEKIGLSRGQMARLESGEIDEIREEVLISIMTLMKEFNKTTEDIK